MPSTARSPNHLLQALPTAEYEALRPHLASVELVRETVLVGAGAPLTQVYLPHSGAISMMVRLSEGQSVEVATIGRDSVWNRCCRCFSASRTRSRFMSTSPANR